MRSNVEVRGCTATIQVVHGSQVIAVHSRHTSERIVIEPGHYDGACIDYKMIDQKSEEYKFSRN